MRYAGLDVGTKTIGVAISDKTNSISIPLKTIRFLNLADAMIEIKNIVIENGITDIAVGLPKNMDGSQGAASQRSKDFVMLLQKYVDSNIDFVDERLTTREAQNILIAQDMRREKRKTVIDSVAAVLILDIYLKMKGE